MKVTRQIIISLASVVVLVSCGKNSQSPTQTPPNNPATQVGGEGIYGDDNRLNLYQITNPATKALADSTVAIFQSYQVKSLGNGTSSLSAGVYGSQMNLCSSERFWSEPRGSFCSGTLVGPDTVVTAGHCISAGSRCSGSKFVFGYAYNDKNQNPKVIKSSDVYSCSRVIQSYNDGATDFAVVKLDRSVPDHKPVPLRKSGSIALNEPVMAIGYPKGIPAKVAAGAYVRNNSPAGYFTTNTDTYAGNSGSGVFNTDTGVMEGILVRGDDDFVRAGSCMVSKRCSNTSCAGESVTRITKVLPYL